MRKEQPAMMGTKVRALATPPSVTLEIWFRQTTSPVTWSALDLSV
jgi:hypothetical protein